MDEDDCKSSDNELLSPDSLPHHSFSLFSPNRFSKPRSSNFHLSSLSSCPSNLNNTDNTPPENNSVHDEPFVPEALKTELPSSLSLTLLPVPNNQSSASYNSASFDAQALENKSSSNVSAPFDAPALEHESLLSNISLSFHAPALENDYFFSSLSFDDPTLENNLSPCNTSAFFDAPALENESSPLNSSASFYAQALQNKYSLCNISVFFDAPSLENECLRSSSLISHHTPALVFSLNSQNSQSAWMSSNESSSTFSSSLVLASENNPSFR